jgi:hypothetical protein
MCCFICRINSANSECHISLLAKSSRHKFCLALKPDVFAICIEKYRFLVFIIYDRTNIRKENWIKSVNKTPLMSEVTIDKNWPSVSKRRHNNIFFQSWLHPTIIYI